MAFLETPRFPDHIMAWSVGGFAWDTTVATNFGGFEKRNKNSSQSRNRFNIANGLRVVSEAEVTMDFWNVSNGRVNGFRVTNPRDYICTDVRGILGTGTGTAATIYQMYRRYTVGAGIYDHKIVKPRASPAPVIYVNFVPQTVGVDYTIDTTTGLVTFAVAPNGQPINWSGQYDFPVRFGTDLQEVGMDPGGLLTWDSIMLIELKDGK